MKQQADKQVNTFTSGEWRTEKRYIVANFSDGNKGTAWLTIGEAYNLSSNVMKDGEALANAKLMASAPALKAENEKLLNDVRALREALEGITRAFKKVSEEHCPDDPICEWLGEAHEALLKTKQD